MKPLKKLIRTEDGPTSVEYAFLLALLLLGCLAAIGLVSQQFDRSLEHSAQSLQEVMGARE